MQHWFAFIIPRQIDFAIKACSLPTAFAIYSGMPKFLCQVCGAIYLERRSKTIRPIFIRHIESYRRSVSFQGGWYIVLAMSDSRCFLSRAKKPVLICFSIINTQAAKSCF